MAAPVGIPQMISLRGLETFAQVKKLASKAQT